jgi:hypothetical protein
LGLGLYRLDSLFLIIVGIAVRVRIILYTTDFSDRCAAVAPMVQTFTGHFEAQLTLLHVVEPLTYNDLRSTAPVSPSANSTGISPPN